MINPTIPAKTFTFEFPGQEPQVYTLPTKPEDVQAAPTGYGLANEFGAAISTLEALDTLTKTGWYLFHAPSDVDLKGLRFNIATVRVEGTSSDFVQTITTPRRETRLYRRCLMGTFKPWVFDNPPRALGVEYKTSEVHKGHSVYVKVISFSLDEFAPDETKWYFWSENGNYLIHELVRAEVRRSSGLLPYFSGSGHISYDISVARGICIETHTLATGADTYEVTLYYTKIYELGGGEVEPT